MIDAQFSYVALVSEIERLLTDKENELYIKAKQRNLLFEPAFIEKALKAIGKMLEPAKMEKWLSKYATQKNIDAKKVGIVMAGNIPGVGFHDFLCTIVAGHKALIKLSSKDDVVMKWLTETMISLNPDVKNRIELVERIEKADAYIATGSSNSARYFEYYFGKKPSIIRYNRTSVAILDGAESKSDLEALADDLFSYFGLGCRNVTKLFIPEEYDLSSLFEAFEKYSWLSNNHTYFNNYEYQKALTLMANVPFFDNGFALLKPSEKIFAPIGVVHYEVYANEKELSSKLEIHQKDIQCVVSRSKHFENAIPFGTTQEPELWNYADGIDTMKFLTELGLS